MLVRENENSERNNFTSRRENEGKEVNYGQFDLSDVSSGATVHGRACVLPLLATP